MIPKQSHSNAWEVKMVHWLVRHLVRQGQYNSKDITVLTPYTGQLVEGLSPVSRLSSVIEMKLWLETILRPRNSNSNWATVKSASFVEVLRIATV